jgi:hypothetical protein
MAKVLRRREGVLTEVNKQKEIDHKAPGVHLGDDLHEIFYDKDGTLKHDGYIKKEILPVPKL